METETKPQAPSAETVQNWMADYICSVLDVQRENFPMDTNFDSFAMDSVEAVIMAGMMEEQFLVQVDPILLFDHPNVTAFTKHFLTLFDS